MNLDAATMDRIKQGITAVALLFGLSLLLGGGYFLEQQREFIARSVAAEGQVIENERVQWTANNGRGFSHTSYRAIVRFTDQRGQAVLYHDKFAFNPPSFHAAQSVTIFYDPQNPQNAMIDRGAKNYLIPGIALALGALITLSWLPRVFHITR